jgi:hypothetical protein
MLLITLQVQTLAENLYRGTYLSPAGPAEQFEAGSQIASRTINGEKGKAVPVTGRGDP